MFWQNSPMGKNSRVIREPMPTLLAWRKACGLSRQEVANEIRTRHPETAITDQATIRKWETGETAVRVTDLKLLAEVYGTTPDRLLFEPGDNITPNLMQRAHTILTTKDPTALDAWLASGEFLPNQANAKKN